MAFACAFSPIPEDGFAEARIGPGRDLRISYGQGPEPRGERTGREDRLCHHRCNIISSHMAHAHDHGHSHAASQAVSDDPGWSLLRLSAWSRVGLAAVVVALLWVATLAVIA